MSFPRYPKYKASGVEWLGDVPEHWEVRRLKSIARQPIQNGVGAAADTDTPGLPRYVRITDIKSTRELHTDTFRSLPVEVAETASFSVGDILFACVGATFGKSYLHCEDIGPVCYAGYLVKFSPKRSFDSRYVSYWSESFEYWSQLDANVIQSTVQNFSASKFRELWLAIPAFDEQSAIASFLDRETAKIDGLVGEQRRLIELLKEKRQAVIFHAVTKGLNPHAPLRPSGIEWLGDVPQNWMVLPLHRVVQERRRITYGIVQPGKADKFGRFMIRNQDFTNGWSDPESIFRVSAAIEEPYERARFKTGDLLMTIVGAGIGNVAIIPEWLDGANTTQNIARIAIEPTKAHPSFVAAVLSGPVGKQCIEFYSKGAAQPSLNLGHLREFVVTVPPLDEQREIAAFIESRANSMETLSAEAERVIELLQERRTALISAAVTGKIDVRSMRTPEGAAHV